MFIFKSVWDGNDDIYVTAKGIFCCWRKYDILPQTWNVDTKTEVGSAPLSMKLKVGSDEL